MLVSMTSIMVTKTARVKPGTGPEVQYDNKLELISEDTSLELPVLMACHARSCNDVNSALRKALKVNFPCFRAYSASNR